MDKEQIIEYLYENNVRGDLTIEQMAEDLADRKTENSSEKPNNCTNCECTDDCTECREAEHGCKDEPQTERRE